nr:hypothetical protein [Tanacetum cinerariifolium]
GAAPTPDQCSVISSSTTAQVEDSPGLAIQLIRAAPLMSPRQDETSEPLLYAGWMAGLYRCKDATRVSHSMEARRSNGLIQMVDASRCTLGPKELKVECPFKP